MFVQETLSSPFTGACRSPAAARSTLTTGGLARLRTPRRMPAAGTRASSATARLHAPSTKRWALHTVARRGQCSPEGHRPRLFESCSGSFTPRFWQGFCVRGDTCLFSHGVFEGWLHPSRYRTQLCKDGINCHRAVCFFAHSLAELRTPTYTWMPSASELNSAGVIAPPTLAPLATAAQTQAPIQMQPAIGIPASEPGHLFAEASSCHFSGGQSSSLPYNSLGKDFPGTP